MNEQWLDEVAWSAEGLVPAVAQDAGTGQVLMVAWMTRESLRLTARDGVAVYWSRSRGRLWRKGEASGHTQTVRAIRLDCDGDTVLLSVEQHGGIACHTGRAHCFYRTLDADAWRTVEPVLADPADLYGAGRGGGHVSVEVLARLGRTLAERRGADPSSSYVASLYAGGDDRILKKVGEEATEVIIAGKSGDVDALVREVADLWFHTLVLLAHHGVGPERVVGELDRRTGRSGLEEKAARGGVRPGER